MSDRVIFVTGASRGIGNVIFKNLKKENYIVYGISKTKNSDKSIYKCDITNYKDLKNIIEKIIVKHGSIHCVVNNAGIVSKTKINKMSNAEWDRIIKVNLYGVFYLTKIISNHFIDMNKGKIINISSIAGNAHSKTASVAYTASKAAVNGLTRQLAYDLAKYNIQINSICPSQTMTDMLKNSVEKRILDNLVKENPSRRLLEPKEIFSLVRFLISDDSNYINGACININGGLI